jgi:hypothetical protein
MQILNASAILHILPIKFMIKMAEYYELAVQGLLFDGYTDKR